MRIAIVSDYCRPWPGGISEHVHHEAVELRRRGHAAFVISGPNDAGPRDDVLRTPWALRFGSNGGEARMALGMSVLRLGELLRRLRVDVVHCHAPLDPVLPLAAVLASPVPVVGTFHASFRPAPLWELLYRAARPITGWAFARLAARVAVSAEARRSIERYFPAEYAIIPNGVDVDRFHPGVEPLPRRDRGLPTILFVGRADPRKGLPLLLEAMPAVRRRVPGARLVVAGAREADVLPRPCLGDAVTFAGYVAPEDLPRYYASCDVFCSPAIEHESQGIVLLEAMAAGRAVVAFDIPGYRDVVADGGEGRLVSSLDAAALADALVELLADPVRRDAMGERGRATALGYAWPAVADRLEALFERARSSLRPS